jgi:predicted nucleotidyltransferase component of viral defense system
VTKRAPQNVAASVHARLLNRSRETGEDFRFILHRYAAERFLYRLGRSPYRDQYVLKGAMLYALWGGAVYRPTHDLDFTGYGSDDVRDVLLAFREVCLIPVEDDGVVFDVEALSAETIRHDSEYAGLRVNFAAKLGAARIPMQIDIGFGDAIEPQARDVEYPTLLQAPAPNIRAYPHEAVVAEKLHALVVLGERTSRMKDIYDLHTLAAQFAFDGATLSGAIGATFRRRVTPITTAMPVALTPRFFTDDRRAGQWRAYLDRNRLPGAPADLALAGERLLSFLGPVWTALGAAQTFAPSWREGGPWRDEAAS